MVFWYPLLTNALLPFARLYLKKRAKKQPAYLEHWDERFGEKPFPAPEKGHRRLWLHAVSVGETAAARTLIDQFLKADAKAQILLTCMTPTGRDIGEKIAQKYPGRITQCYLPYDTPRLMGKFLDETAPELGLVMETEVWPNLIHEANKRQIPLILTNARESEKSFKSAMRVKSLMRPAFAGFSAILAQSEADKKRLERLGGHDITVCGSVKFDVTPDEKQVADALELKKKVARPVLLMASTRQGEESFFVEEIKKLPPNVLTLLVPRHPQRFDEVARLLASHRLTFARKSESADLVKDAQSVQVLLADTMGEMSFNSALGDVCIMGGSFGDFGCQNLIEPAACGNALIIGPSSFNFAKPVDDAVKVGAAVRVESARDAIATAAEWFRSDTLSQRRDAARTFAASYTGATDKMMSVILRFWKH